MKLSILSAGLVLAGAMSANAADLVVNDPVAVADAGVIDALYLQFLGGVALPGAQDWVSDFDSGEWALDAGYAIAVTAGVVVIDGLSVEVDGFFTKRAFTDEDGSSSTSSLMANLKYSVDVNDTFALYGAAGVGFIHEAHETGGSETGFNGAGYQLIAGVTADVTENIAVVAEYRYQNSFGPLVSEVYDDWTHQVPVHALLMGAKIAF